MDIFARLFNPSLWLGYLEHSARALLLAIPVAAGFELAHWLTRRAVLKRLNQVRGAEARGVERDPAARARRRRMLRDATLAGLRWLWTAAAVIVILTLWRLDPVAVALLLAAVVVAARGLAADLLVGYTLWLDDVLAPGDRVVVNDGPEGVVIEQGLRAVRLADDAGRTWWIRAGEVRRVGVWPSGPAAPAEGEA